MEDDGNVVRHQHETEWAENDIWDENDKLVDTAKPYTDSTTIMKLNHPLMIMVKEQRTVSSGNEVALHTFKHLFLRIYSDIPCAWPWCGTSGTASDGMSTT